MSALHGDYADCAILIYDSEGDPLATTTVSSHDKITKRVELQEVPDTLVDGSTYRLLILSSPIPCVYKGRLV